MAGRPPNLDLVRHLSRNLKTLREQAMLTQEELAEKAGVSPRYIQFLEAGKQLPSLTIANALREALETTWNRLMKTG